MQEIKPMAMIKKNTVIASVVLIVLALASMAIGIYFYFRNSCFRHDMSIVLGWFVVSAVLMTVSAIVLRNNIKSWFSLPLGFTIILIVVYSVCWGFGKSQYEWNLAHGVIQSPQNSSDIHNNENYQGNGAEDEKSAPVGTYQVTDKAGNKWLISVNEDETIVIEGTDNSAYYGSWHLYKGKIETSFTSDGYIYPPLIFSNSESTDGMYLVIDLKEDYIYASNSAKSKNPRKRLPITKVK